MKSPETKIMYLEHAIRIQRLIEQAEIMRDGSLFLAKDKRRSENWLHGSKELVRKNIRDAWRYRRIYNYLVTRYKSLIAKLN